MSKDTAPMTAEEPDTYPMPEHGWTCFFCGETFKKEGTARDHFGNRPGDRPAACLIKAEHNLSMELRRAERERDQARAEGFAAGMEEAAGIADAEEVPEADDAPSALREARPVQAAISAIVVTKACIAAAIRARAAEGAKAEKGEGWRTWLVETLDRIAATDFDVETAIVCGEKKPTLHDAGQIGFGAAIMLWTVAIKARLSSEKDEHERRADLMRELGELPTGEPAEPEKTT